MYAGGVLAVLLYGCESWCLTAESVRRLANWHNKRIREMCRVTMLQTYVYRITSESLQKRTRVFSLEHYLASRTLLWAGHVARMHKNRLPKRLMLSWISEPRVAGGQEMTYGLRAVASTSPGPLQPPSGLHGMGSPGAGPRQVAQARDRASLQTWQALRALTKRRHQGDPGGQAALGGTARGRDRRAAGGLQRHQQLRR